MYALWASCLEMMDWLRERKLNQEGNNSQGKTQISEAKNCQMRERERERKFVTLQCPQFSKCEVEKVSIKELHVHQHS